MMAVSQEQVADNKMFVQVLTIGDMADAAVLTAADLGQNLQIVTMQAPNTGVAATSTQELMFNGATITNTTAPANLDGNAATITTTTTNNNESSVATTTTDNSNAAASGSAGSMDDRLCMICGDRANGVHYNVLSCEGCKSFFLRSNRSGATFTCAQGGNCSMDLYTRRHCPACRMKKCIECGMKVERVWDKSRLLTRKPLIRRKRKKRQPNTPVEQPQTPTTLTPPAPTAATTPPQPLPVPSGADTTITPSPSSSRSNSPSLAVGQPTVTPPSFPNTPTLVSIPPTVPEATDPDPSLTIGGDGQDGDLVPMTEPDPAPGTSTQTLLTLTTPYPQLTPEQEQLMLTLEKGYNASTEVLEHLSQGVPLFRMTHWSKLKSSGSANDSSPEEESEEDEDEEMEPPEPKKCKVETNTGSNANTNSQQVVPAAATTSASIALTPGSDPLAVLSAATGQNIDIIYKLTSLATGGQITDPTSALNVLASSEQGMRVIQTIGSMVQGQDLNTLISLASIVGQVIGMGGGSLNDNIADTILGSITGTIMNGSLGLTLPGPQPPPAQTTPSATTESQDQNGNKPAQQSSPEEAMNPAAIAKLASSGLAEILAMLAAMASSSQNKETIVEMVKRAALSLLKGHEEQQVFSSSSSSSTPASNFYMPTDVGEDEVKTSPFLQSLQRVTSFLTSGKMSKKSGKKSKRTVNKEMLHIAMDMFAVLVKQTIHFAKSIPGFTNLSCDDQAVLIKSSIVDALLLRCADSYALDKDCLVNNTNGDKFDVHMMYQLGFSTLPEVVFEFMRDTKACGLTTAEYALFTAAALLSPDRSDLKDRKTVEEMQLEMILALQAATKVFHSDRPFLFTKLITKLTTLRDMSILHLSEIMAVKVQECDLSPLIVELFGLDS